MVAPVSLFSVCIFSGQSAFEGLGYLIPRNQQDFLGSLGDSGWKGLQEVPGRTSSSKQGLAPRLDQVTQGFTQSGLETFEKGDCTTSQCNLFQCQAVLVVKAFFFGSSLNLFGFNLHPFSYPANRHQYKKSFKCVTEV